MATVTKVLRFSAGQSVGILFKIRRLLAAIVAVLFGIVIAQTATASQESIELIASLLVITLLMLMILNRPIMGFLAAIFLIPFIETWIEIPLGRGIPDLSFSRFALVFLTITLLFQAVNGRFHFRPITFIDGCVLLIPIGFMISAPLAGNPLGVIQTGISLHFLPAALYFFAKNLVRDRDDLHALLLTIALFGCIAGAHAIYESLTGNIIFLEKGQEITRFYRGDTSIRLIKGLIGGTGAMGRVLATTIVVSLYLIAEHRSAWWKTFLMGGLVLQFGGLLVTFSRTPMIALFLALIILQIVFPQFRKAFVVLAILGTIFVAANWERLQNSDIGQQRISEGTDDAGGRLTRWSTGLNMWKDKPIRGWGTDKFSRFSSHYRTDGSRREFDAVENDFLFILIGTGLIGFLPYLLFLLIPFFKSFRLFVRARAPDWKGFITYKEIVLYWTVLLILFIGSMTSKNTDVVVKYLPFVIVGAIIGTHVEYISRRETAPLLSKSR